MQLFWSPQQQFRLVVNCCQRWYMRAHNLDMTAIAQIIVSFYMVPYSCLEHWFNGTACIGLEAEVSQLVRHMSWAVHATHQQCHQKCILLSHCAQNSESLLAFLTRLTKSLTGNDPILLGLGNNDDVAQLRSVVDSNNAQQCAVVLIDGMEMFTHYDSHTAIVDKVAATHSYEPECSDELRKMHCVLYALHDMLPPTSICVGIAKQTPNMDVALPAALLKPGRFDCCINFNHYKPVPFKQQIESLQVPIGVHVRFIDASQPFHGSICEYSPQLTALLSFGRRVTQKMTNSALKNTMSMLVYGAGKGGKTCTVSKIAWNTNAQFIVRLEFDDMIANSSHVCYDYGALVQCVKRVWDIADSVKQLCVIVIDNLDALLPSHYDDITDDAAGSMGENDPFPKTNPLLNVVLTWMRRKCANRNYLFIASSNFARKCALLQIERYFDFVQRIPLGMIRSSDAVEMMLKSLKMNICFPNVNTLLLCIQNVLTFRVRFDVETLMKLCYESKHRYGCVDALWIYLKSLPFLFIINEKHVV